MKKAASRFAQSWGCSPQFELCLEDNNFHNLFKREIGSALGPWLLTFHSDSHVAFRIDVTVLRRCWDQKKKKHTHTPEMIIIICVNVQHQITIHPFKPLNPFPKSSFGGKKNVGGILREWMGGGEVSGYRDGVNEEPLQEAVGRSLVDLELADGFVGGKNRVNKGKDEEEFSSAP